MIKKAANLILVIIILTPFIYSQSKVEKNGIVTFISGDVIYFSFNETEGIKIGDTLYKSDKKPVAKVFSVASKSLSGNYINPEVTLNINDKVVVYVIREQEQKSDSSIINENKVVNEEPEKELKESITSNKKDIYGRFTIQSYSSLSNYEVNDIQRWRYSFSFRADNIIKDKLSFSNYIIFTYRADRWNDVKDNFGRALKIYDLYINYRPENNLQLILGRNINKSISNIGPIDGLQGEIKFAEFFTGIILGFRPNFTDMGFNSKLLQYGGYIGRTDTINNALMENTAAIVQQNYHSKVDRRFLYFQHNNSIIKNTFFFASFEADLYERNKADEEKNIFSLTGSYLMLRVNPFRELSLSASYDARKNVIYYESFKTHLDSLFENELRQGFNLNTNLRLLNNLYVYLNYGYRYKRGDIKPSQNYGGSISYSNIPYLESYASLSFNKIMSNYLSGNLIGFRISKGIDLIGSELAINYRNTEYSFLRSSSIQNSIGVDINTKIVKNLYFNLSYEGIFEGKLTSGKFIVDLNTRF